MEKPKKTRRKYQLVTVENPHYAKQMTAYKAHLNREIAFASKRLNSLKAKLRKLDHE